MLAIRRRACSVSSERHIRELGVRYLRALNKRTGLCATSTARFCPLKGAYISVPCRGAIFRLASGTSPVRYTSLPDLHEWFSSQLWCGEYPDIPLGKRSQVA